MPCAACALATFKGQRVLIVERFDRALSLNGKWIMRLPQEDLAQATKTPPGQKYERDRRARQELQSFHRGRRPFSPHATLRRTFGVPSENGDGRRGQKSPR
ncbi:MAG: HipA domain-containing protein [Myxococcaceae bacterium]|nr:HipA domain-containing protein [Myxococcaceae bacterium]